MFSMVFKHINYEDSENVLINHVYIEIPV